MSTSANFGGGLTDLRYEWSRCFCKKRAKIKIVESNKPSKGRLYYICEDQSCSFWAWCNPLRRDGMGNECTSKSPETRLDESSGFSPRVNSNEGMLAVNNGDILLGLHAKLSTVEGTVGMLKVIMILSLIICCLSLVIAAYRK